MIKTEINRKRVTESENFVWIPTGNSFGVPDGIVGYWNGEKKGNVPVIEFPEGKITLGSEFVKMYEPTEKEIDDTLNNSKRWAERFEEATDGKQ